MKVKDHRQMMRSLTDPLNIPKLRALLEANPVLTPEEFKARQAQLIPEEWDELSPKEELYYQQGPFSTHEDFRGAEGGIAVPQFPSRRVRGGHPLQKVSYATTRTGRAEGGTPQLVQPGPGRPGYGGKGSGAKPHAGEIKWAHLEGDALKNVKTWGKNKGWTLAETKKNYESSTKHVKHKVRTGITTGSKKKSIFEILDKEQEEWFRKHIFNNPDEKFHKTKWKDI